MRTLPINRSSAKALPRILLALTVFFSLTLIGFASKAADKNKSRSKAKTANSKKSRADKGREKSAKNSRLKERSTKNEKSKSAKNGKNKKEDRRSSASAKRNKRGREDSRVAKNSKRNNKREVARNERKKSWRKMSRRERLAELRRIRAAEAARRRAIEEARRRELAFLKALKDEATNNIQNNDDTTGEDMEVRRAAIAALEDKVGTVVVMNPKTGQIYSIVNQGWGIGKGFKPCSTVKLVTSVAGLKEGEINVEEEATYAPNRLNLVDALAFSNNGYFQSVGGRVGFDKMKSYAKDLGLGEKTGINLPNESSGAIPQEKTGYAVNHMSSHGDSFEVTPIQLATMVSALGNGGNLLAPRVLRSEQEKLRFNPQVRRQLDLPQKTLDDVMPGMVGAVNFGTAKGSQTPGYFIAGKTGSCTGQGTKLGLFASYGPVGDPQLAVVVITRGPGQKGKIAASVAGKIYRSLSYRFTKPASVPIARIPTAPRQRGVTLTSDEDTDEDDATSAQNNGEQGNSDANGATTTDASDNKVEKIGITVPKNAPQQQQTPANKTQQKPTQPTVQPIIIQAKPSEKQKQSAPSNNAAPEGQRPRLVTPKSPE